MMQSRTVRLTILAVTASAIGALLLGAAAFSYADTLYVLPTTATVAIPTSYAVGTSYVLPSAYVVPTYYARSYYPTSYYSTAYYYPSSYYVADSVSLYPTSYVASVFERRGLFGRRRWLVERPVVAAYSASYLPTSYYVPTYYSAATYTPTVYESPVVWETSYVAAAPSICDELVSTAPVQTARASDSYRSGGTGSSRRVESEMEGPVIPSDVAPLPSESGGAGAAGRGAADGAARKKVQSQVGEQGTPPPVPEAPAGGAAVKKAAPPRAPADQNEGEIEGAPGGLNPAPTRRDSLRPAYSLRPASLRNVLSGRVETESGEPREEVRVTVSSSADAGIFREALTNAFGQFAVRLRDGNWTVKVTMPSGRVYPVRQISVRDGRIIDNREGRDIPNLVIWY
jgi:hypothetical protein